MWSISIWLETSDEDETFGPFDTEQDALDWLETRNIRVRDFCTTNLSCPNGAFE